ncbi:GNAT family N-acetyltransferase [Amycolatopsis sp. NPDC059021]|uniref:GNAT family N-acetyltransferase n=1 Tax=Amycolatopsis sp. NPDC059021 TaxID=3346704 RepID=UPI00366AA652
MTYATPRASLGHVIDIEALRVQPDLAGEKVVLTQLDESHLDDSWASLQDQEVTRFTGTHATFTYEQIRKWNASRPGLTDRADWAILRAEDRAYVGDAALTNVDADNASASFRIALSTAAEFGRGYGTEATRLLLDYAFDVVGLHRVQLEVFDFNTRARRVYEKCGFVAEGVQREALRWDGAWHDVILMAVLASDRRG